MRTGRVLAPLRRPATIVGAGFLAIAGGIFANALLLQDDRHPAPLFSARWSAGGERPAAQRDTLVEAIQAGLRDAGLYAGPVDGMMGPRTAAAIRTFEAATGRLQTGRPTAPLLAAILAPQPAPPSSAPPSGAPASGAEPASVGSVVAEQHVAAVQGALSRAAYGQITPDGVMGPQTRDAIRRFQADHGLPLTGTVTDALMVELRAAGALEGD